MRFLRRLARALGLRRRETVPFGMRWYDDVAALGPPPEVVLDIGANLGQTVREVRRAFPRAVVHAFEPVPSTYRALAGTFHGIDTVRTVQAAVGEAAGTAQMTDSPLSEWNTLRTEAHPDLPTVDVPVLTVDGYRDSESLARIDLLKIDTEGHELAVLRGAEESLRAGAVRLVLAECDFTTRPGMPHAHFADLLDYLHPLGYRVVSFYCHGVDGEGWIWGDVLFLHAGSLTTTLAGPRQPWPPIVWRPGRG